MANQDFYYPTPPISVTATNPSVGTNGGAAPTSSTEIGYIVAGVLTGATGTANGLKVDGSSTVQPVSAGGTDSANAPLYNVYSTTNILTSAYVQLVASATNTINSVSIFDSSGQAMILATGGAGSEVVKLYIPPGGGTFPIQIAAGTRVAYKALTANATSGYLTMSFLR